MANARDTIEPFPSPQPTEATQLPSLIEQRRHLVFDAGEPAFDSLDTRRNFYFILSGRIKISQVNPENGREQTLHLLERGDMFDVLTLLDGAEHEYIATTIERAEVVEVPLSQVRELIETNPAFNRYFFPYLAKQMRELEALAVDLSLYDVYHRLLRLIARNVDNAKTRSLRLIHDLSHEELASLVGSVRKVVNRNLQALKADGIVDISRKRLKLKDLQRLLDKLKY